MTTLDEFVSEPVVPVFAAGTASAVQAGAPVLPAAFEWHGKTVGVVDVLSTWKQSGDCTHGSGEKYLRRHCYRLKMADGAEWEVYFERRARSAGTARRRWWLYKRHAPSTSDSSAGAEAGR